MGLGSWQIKAKLVVGILLDQEFCRWYNQRADSDDIFDYLHKHACLVGGGKGETDYIVGVEVISEEYTAEVVDLAKLENAKGKAKTKIEKFNDKFSKLGLEKLLDSNNIRVYIGLHID